LFSWFIETLNKHWAYLMVKRTLQRRLNQLLREYNELRAGYRKTKEWDLEKLEDLDNRKAVLLQAIRKAM